MFAAVDDYPRTLAEFEARFNTEEACAAYLARLRWPSGFQCPGCGSAKAWPLRTGRWQCAGCGRQTSVTAGTIFQDTRTRVHRVVSLLKRWLLGTHQGRVGHAHLDYYLDEFTFRFNRRRSRHRGKLFFRLVQQAVAIEPIPYRRLVQDGRRSRR